MSTHWKSYESCTSSAKKSRKYAVYFAERRDWDRAYAHAASAKTAQLKADEHFEFYLDALALNGACEVTESKEERELRKAFEYAEYRRKARALLATMPGFDMEAYRAKSPASDRA